MSLSDGNDLINYVNGGYGSNAHTVLYLPPYPTGLGTILSTGPDPAVSLPSALQVGTDGTLAVPVDIDDPLPAANDGMTEATVALTYDPAVLSVSPSDIHLGSVPASGSGWTLQSNIDQATGQIAVTILSTTPIASSTAGSLVVIDFHQTGLTAAGTTTVNLVDSVDPNGSAPIYTQVDGQQGPFVLSPAPANAYNPQIDALVTLAGAEGATGSASALSQLTASVVAGPVAPVSAAAAVQALGPVSPSAGAAQVPQTLGRRPVYGPGPRHGRSGRAGRPQQRRGPGREPGAGRTGGCGRVGSGQSRWSPLGRRRGDELAGLRRPVFHRQEQAKSRLLTVFLPRGAGRKEQPLSTFTPHPSPAVSGSTTAEQVTNLPSGSCRPLVP